MKFKVIILNGYPQSGKDEFCNIAGRHFFSYSISSVDNVKIAAEYLGWDGNKDPKSRKFLSILKDFSTEYFDGPFEYIKNEIKVCSEFYERNMIHNKIEFLFVHIREPKEIQKVNDYCSDVGIFCYSVFIDREGTNKDLSNHADKNVENYKYDYTVFNNGTLDKYEKTVFTLLKELREREESKERENMDG